MGRPLSPSHSALAGAEEGTVVEAADRESGLGATARRRRSLQPPRGPLSPSEPALSHAFNIELLTSIHDVRPKLRVGLSWPDVIEVIGAPRPSLSKGETGGVAMFTAAEHEAGKSIAKDDPNKAGVIGAHFGIWDLDHVYAALAERAVGVLERENLSYLYVTSFSHGTPASEIPDRKRPKVCVHCRAGGLVRPSQGNGTSWRCDHCQGTWTTICARVVVPFSRMVSPGDEWETVWERVDRDVFGRGVTDQSAKSIARRYFVPTYREGGGAPPERRWRDAGLLAVDRLLAGPSAAPGASSGPAGAPAAGGQKITRDQLRGIAKRLGNSPSKKWLSSAIFALVKGESFAESGSPGRHNTMVRIVYEILDQYPLVDPASVSAHFAPSLQAMQPTKVTLEEIENVIATKAREPRAAYASQVAEAFGWERKQPYTEGEIEATANAVGARPMEMQHRWVIQCGSSFYVLCGDRYWCYPKESALAAIRRDLAPHPGIVLTETAAKGNVRQKTLDEIIRDYGAVATGVEVHLTAQRAYYDPVRRIMVEAPTPIAVSAEYSPEVEEWLGLLAGPLAERLNQWLACVTLLALPCVALYLEGGPDTGKSLFLTGVARVYGRRPAELEGALGGFNEEIMVNPVVVADEHLPEDARGQVRTEAIRKFVQDRERALNRKYKQPATVIGASRVILAANNHDKLIHTTETLNNHDIAAITERFLVIPAQDEARVFLQRNRAMVERWGQTDAIAKHTVWLCENLQVERYGRFLVKGEAKGMTNSLSTGSGLRAGVCQWVMGLLQKPAVLLSRPGMSGLVRVQDGKLLLTAKVMAEAWNEYIPERASPPPTPSKVSRALGGLSEEVCLRVGGKPQKMRVFNLEQLATWAEDTGYGDLDTIRELVGNLERLMNRPAATSAAN